MDKKEKVHTGIRTCGHCGVHAAMEIVASYVDTKEQGAPDGPSFEAGPYWHLTQCPGCKDVMLETGHWHEAMDYDPDDVGRFLYPVPDSSPKGLPEELRGAYEAMRRVRSIDANSYGMLAGRLLETICIERNAKGKTLNEQLSDLAKRGELPTLLVDVAHKVRSFRNVGAHAGSGSLSKAELPVIDDLVRAVLDYLYTAPHLVRRADLAMKRLTNRNKAKGGKQSR